MTDRTHLSRHPTIMLQHPAGHGVDVDTLMADLIRECWQLGISTSECCQEAARGTARIGFLTLADMEHFYDAATDHDGDDGLFFNWKWELWADGGLRGTVHFPASQIRWLARCFAAQVKRSSQQGASVR